MKNINLSIPSEPIQVREYFRKELEKGSKMMQANIKQGTWIASPLWTELGWGSILKGCGFSWQNLMEAVRDNYYSFIKWANGEKSWDIVTNKRNKFRLFLFSDEWAGSVIF